MKSLPTILLAVALSLPSTALFAEDAKSVLTEEKDKLGYAFGIRAGQYFQQMKTQGFVFDIKATHQAIDDIFEGKTPAISEAEAKNTITAVQGRLRTETEAKRKVAGEKNSVDGAKFLEENKSKEGVITLPSGLQYKVVKQGDGATPASDDTVRTHYRGTLIDGTEFDSSYKRGEPAEFAVTGVIKGWTEALQLMKVGSKLQLYVPPTLAYGERGAGANIGPNSTLIFDIELVSIKPKASEAVVTSDIIKVPSAEELKNGAKIEVIKASDVEKLQKEADAAKKAADGVKKK